jgi:GNAT superfamily N-acetyltransferase
VAQFPPGYQLRSGSERDRSLLVKFLQRTYAELFPGGEFSHLKDTVDQYFSSDTPTWWVELQQDAPEAQLLGRSATLPIGCLWMGRATDLSTGETNANIFLLFVEPNYRRLGIGSALVRYAENWAKVRGDRQIGLQVFQSNQPALTLYQTLGYRTQSLWMIKTL